MRQGGARQRRRRGGRGRRRRHCPHGRERHVRHRPCHGHHPDRHRQPVRPQHGYSDRRHRRGAHRRHIARVAARGRRPSLAAGRSEGRSRPRIPDHRRGRFRCRHDRRHRPAAEEEHQLAGVFRRRREEPVHPEIPGRRDHHQHGRQHAHPSWRGIPHVHGRQLRADPRVLADAQRLIRRLASSISRSSTRRAAFSAGRTCSAMWCTRPSPASPDRTHCRRIRRWTRFRE